jgi:hypothetical protein
VQVQDWIDVGLQDADGKYLYLQKHRFDRENTELDLTLPQCPARAGIDPLIKLIDRKPDDNVTPVR